MSRDILGKDVLGPELARRRARNKEISARLPRCTECAEPLSFCACFRDVYECVECGRHDFEDEQGELPGSLRCDEYRCHRCTY